MGRITVEGGLSWDNETGVGEAFVTYFTNLFTKGPMGDYNPCTQPLDCRVTEAMNLELLGTFTVEEIRAALF